MYKICKTEQSSQRQRQIEQGLFELMRTKRYEDISISDLCQRLQIPRKSFYRYFSGKDGALFALLDHTMLEFYTESLGTAKGGTALGDLELFFLFWYEQKELLSALRRSGLSGILVERATALAQRERLMPGKVRGWTTAQQEHGMAFALCGLMSMIIQWHEKGYSIPPQEMTQIAINMLTKPLIEI